VQNKNLSPLEIANLMLAEQTKSFVVLIDALLLNGRYL